MHSSKRSFIILSQQTRYISAGGTHHFCKLLVLLMPSAERFLQPEQADKVVAEALWSIASVRFLLALYALRTLIYLEIAAFPEQMRPSRMSQLAQAVVFRGCRSVSDVARSHVGQAKRSGALEQPEYEKRAADFRYGLIQHPSLHHDTVLTIFIS